MDNEDINYVHCCQTMTPFQSKIVVLLLDLDNTLIRTDSSDKLYELINPKKHIIATKCLNLLNPITRLLSKLLGIDLRKFLLFYLSVKGINKNAIDMIITRRLGPLIENFSDDVLVNLLQKIDERFHKHFSKNKSKILKILYTASFEPIARYMCIALKFDLCIGSPFIIHKDIVTGYYDLYGKKALIIDKVLKKLSDFLGHYHGMSCDIVMQKAIDVIIVFDDDPERLLKGILEKYAKKVKIFRWINR